METKFQTSFIPKKPISPTGMAGNVPIIRRQRSSVVMVLATLIFIASLGAGAGTYAWKYILQSDRQTLKKQLTARQEQFDLGLIKDLKRVNIQINTARQLMDGHLSISQIFDSVSRLTAEKVRFMNLDLTVGATAGNNSSGVNISMNGMGTDLSTVAFQSQVLSQLEQYGLRNVVKNPILSDPTENDKSGVTFRFSATVDPQTLLYSKTVAPAASADTQTSTQ